jgi:hypothetical protein
VLALCLTFIVSRSTAGNSALVLALCLTFIVSRSTAGNSALVLALCLTFIVSRSTAGVTGGLRLEAARLRNLPFKLRYQLGHWDAGDLTVKVAKIRKVIAAKVVNSSGGHGWTESGERRDGSWCEPPRSPALAESALCRIE